MSMAGVEFGDRSSLWGKGVPTEQQPRYNLHLWLSTRTQNDMSRVEGT